jgi:hypothetical protein
LSQSIIDINSWHYVSDKYGKAIFNEVIEMNRTTLQLKKMALVVTMLGLATGVQAAQVDGDAEAIVVTPLEVTPGAEMDFGDVASGPLGGTVILATDGGRTTSGDGQALPSQTGTAATFTIDGLPNANIAISFVAGQLDDPTAGGGGAPMAVGTFTTNPSPTQIPGTGTVVISVGATLTLGVNQPAATYRTDTGDGQPYEVTVNYN